MSRLSIDLDDDLLRETLKASGESTKKAAIEVAMREFINARRRQHLIERIKKGELGLDLTHEELRRMRGRG